MIRETIETAKTVDEAIDLGAAKLGTDRADLQFEILELPKKGFLGLVNTPAKVRVYMEVEEPQEVLAPVKEILKQKEPEAVKAPEQSHKAQAAAEPSGPADELQLKKAEVAKQYLCDIFKSMGLNNVQIETKVTNESASFMLSGEGLGVIIGRRGETLDSLQYLTSLVINRMGGDYLRITLDSGDYREKRKSTLENLARKMANTAVKTGRSSTLEPMNPYERRIIHAAVSTVKGATSTSVGEEPNRRVVISSVGGRRSNGGQRGGNRSGGYRGGRSSGGANTGYSNDRKPQQNTSAVAKSTERAATPGEAQGKPLYGKIDI